MIRPENQPNARELHEYESYGWLHNSLVQAIIVRLVFSPARPPGATPPPHPDNSRLPEPLVKKATFTIGGHLERRTAENGTPAEVRTACKRPRG